MEKLGNTEEWHTWADRAVSAIIARDSFGPYPDEGAKIRCHLIDGQVIDGTAIRIWLDLDVVRVDVIPLVTRGMDAFRLTLREGDGWEPLH